MPQEQLDITTKVLGVGAGLVTTPIKLQIRRTKADVAIIDPVTFAQIAAVIEISDSSNFDWNNTVIITTAATGFTPLFRGEVAKYEEYEGDNHNESSLMKRFNISHQIWVRLWGLAAALPANDVWLSMIAYD